MTDIIGFVLLVACLYLLYKLTCFITKRILLLVRLGSLKKSCKAKIGLHTFIFKPMLIKSKKPDITVQILDTVYRIRLYSGGGISKFVHFANRKYSVIHSRLKLRGYAQRVGFGTSVITRQMLPVRSKVRLVSDIERKEEGKNVVDVLLFNPAPAEVSYVSEERNTIKLAFTGDEMYGYRIFTASTFARFAERQYRRDSDAAEARAAHYY